MDERREHRRFPVTVAVEFKTENGWFWGKALDMSVSGLGVAVDEMLEPGKEVGLILYLWERDSEPDQTRPLSLGGRVAWYELLPDGSHRAGVQFEDLGEAEQRELQHFVNRLEQAQ